MKKRMVLGLFVLLLTVLILWTVWGNSALQLHSYTVEGDRIPSAFFGFRIAQVSDLHNEEFGAGNRRLLALLAEASPDLIVVTGDLIDSRHPDAEVALAFLAEAVSIAPCYYVSGNHEAAVEGFGSLKTQMTLLGVTVLENSQAVLERNGEQIRLLGLKDPAFSYGNTQTVLSDALQPFLEAEGDPYTLLLSHRPEAFHCYVASGVDLVLSGHAHGGQFRLPFVGGLYAPGQGFFPEYDGGLYTEGRTHMIVSRGLGNSLFPFRWNNRPELVLVELQSR